MKKIIFSLLLLTVMFVGINVKAKYSSYETGDVVVINGRFFVVVEDSDSNNDKLKLFSRDIAISNQDELDEICSDGGQRSSSDDGIIKCYVDHAELCNLDNSTNNCNLIELPFEERYLEEEEQLIYDENSETNIGYFLKNKVEPYYKRELDLNYLKISLLTSEEHINYYRKFDSEAADNLVAEYRNACIPVTVSMPDRNMLFSNSSGSIVGKENDVDYLDDTFMVNSLEYTATCKRIVGYSYKSGDIGTNSYDEYNYIRPVLEVSKSEFEFELSKEVEGNGSLKIDVGKTNTYKPGDQYYFGGKSFIVISAKNNQLRLMSLSPMGISNMEEISQLCVPQSSGHPTLKSGSDGSINSMEEAYSCLYQHMQICMSDIQMLGNPRLSEDVINSSSCVPISFPYNIDNIDDYSFNPEKETNIGYLLKNDLKETLGDNIIDIDLLKIDEVYILELLMGPMIYDNFPPASFEASSRRAATNNGISVSVSRFGLLNYNDVMNLVDTYSTPPMDLVYPVITISTDDINASTKSGRPVTVTTEPDEGYELVELTVTNSNNQNVSYNPSNIVRQGKGTYTFTMPSDNTNVYAKFIKVDRYDAKSMSEELTVIDGLNHLPGDRVTCRISLGTGDTLERIVYYNDDNNEIEVPYEENNGEYTFTMPDNNVFLRAVINYYTPMYNLYGMDVNIPVQKSKEGGTLTFTVDGTKVIKSITYKLEDGTEIHPYYSVNNGTYSIIMPANDVFVSVEYMESNAQGDAVVPEEKDIDKVPITGDNIYKSIMYLTISLIILGLCFVAHKKNNPRKKVLIPYDMV